MEIVEYAALRVIKKVIVEKNEKIRIKGHHISNQCNQEENEVKYLRLYAHIVVSIITQKQEVC